MPEAQAALLSALRALLPAGVQAAWADPQQDHPLLAGEGLAQAIPARLREYAAGRAAARSAMGRALPIPPGPDRAPQWPPGWCGSITHTRTHCLAVAGRAETITGIGLDLEPADPLDPSLWSTVLRPEDCDALPDQSPGLHAKVIFCAKEAAYKAQYPQSLSLLDFPDMTVTTTGSHFTATFTKATPPFAKGRQIHGHIALVAGHILTLAML
jgi:4'-phosphopantetheinyl transferase EntD